MAILFIEIYFPIVIYAFFDVIMCVGGGGVNSCYHTPYIASMTCLCSAFAVL